MEEESAQCSICLEPLSDSPPVTLDCDHKFHADCIVKWFRGPNQQCPMCRGNPTQIYSYVHMMERYKILRRKARNKKAPASLKKAVEKLRGLEKNLKTKQKEIKSLKELYKDQLTEWRAKRTERHKINRSIWKLKKRIGKMDDDKGLIPQFMERAWIESNPWNYSNPY